MKTKLIAILALLVISACGREVRQAVPESKPWYHPVTECSEIVDKSECEANSHCEILNQAFGSWKCQVTE